MLRLILALLLCLSPAWCAATYAFITSAGDSTDGSSYSFPGITLCDGTTACTIVVAWHTVNIGTSTLTATITVAGSATTNVVSVRRPVTNTVNTGLVSVDLPAATTSGTIAVSLSASVGRFQIGVHRLTGQSASVYATATSIVDDPSTTIDVPAGGVCIGAGTVGNAVAIPSWTGVTRRYDGIQESLTTRTGGADTFASAQTGLTVGYDASPNLQDTLVVASWGPAASASRRVYVID